jgi:hypothetical protein
MMSPKPRVQWTVLFMSQPAVTASSARQFRAGLNGAVVVFALLFVAAVMPILWPNLPPAMVDYNNHLARMFVLARDGTAQAHPYYQVTWSLIPNLAMDLIVPGIGRHIGVEIANRLFYLLSQILIVTGAMALERAVKGRLQIAGFIALIFLYSTPFTFGFENFEFGLGWALWGFACAVWLQDRSWLMRLAAHTAFIVLLFSAHMFALGIYGFAVGLHELWRAWSRPASLNETFARFSALAIPSLLLAVFMVAADGSVGGSGNMWAFGAKATWFLHILSGYNMVVSEIGVLALTWLIVALARRHALRFEQSGVWLLAGFSALYLAMPFRLFDTAFVDMRIVVALALIMPAFVSVSFPDAIWQRIAIALVATITVINVCAVTIVWLSYREDFTAARKSFELLPKGAIVMTAQTGDGDDPPADLRDYPIFNVPTLAVHYADAFSPHLFTAPGKQPVAPRTPWRRLEFPEGGFLPVKLLKHIVEHGVPAGTPPFVQNWARDFDYLYLIGPSIPNPMPDRLEFVLAGPRFAFYRVRK